MSDDITLLSAMPDPESVRRLEALLLTCAQVDVATQTVVHGEMCARTIMIPAGTVLTGTQTNRDNICIVCGDITVTTDDGPQRLKGFHVLQAKAGFKRAGIAHADTWWTTVHHTRETEMEKIEQEMTNESHLLQTTQLRLKAEKESQACLG